MNTSVAKTARLLGAGLRALIVLTVICGVIYPLAITGVAQTLFPGKADGSEIKDEGGRVVGSSLIGQTYTLPKSNPDDPEEAAKPDLRWFQPRPSNGLGANSVNTQYTLLLSGATNRSADNGAVDGACPKDAAEGTLCAQVTAARQAVVADNSTPTHRVRPETVPADAVTSSGSGLDPHISPAYAELQAHRVAERNKLDVKRVEKLVREHTKNRALGFMGEPRVNVLELNTALKSLTQS
ncbi:potassium-transporting ATPase subunit C [Streptomyces solincola]|uniref:Potassium-transporting ATPase KdpC subunit n=1 Tax=Streptomyces solincola TaxID=2100817 RepID=A0A2S9PZR8_9ACTN|nr:potassium-transporting ATPase subunit C [Streptomyces solincola]PRH79919.1 potassium-transporting ATPase subunit C [Streptomyces solincola]